MNNTPNKIALITGANRGLGLETARQLARDHGFTVILGSRDLAKGEAAAAKLHETSADAHAVQLEVALVGWKPIASSSGIAGLESSLAHPPQNQFVSVDLPVSPPIVHRNAL